MAGSVNCIAVFGRPFVKRFALCYQTVVLTVLSVCLSCLSMTVHYGQTVGPIRMKLGTQVGLGSGYIVLDGDPAPPPQRGTAHQFSAHKMPLGTEVGLDPGHILLDGGPTTQLPLTKWHSLAPHFSSHVYCGRTVAHLSYC